MLIDIHTHDCSGSGHNPTVLNIRYAELSGFEALQNRTGSADWFSAGIHPWEAGTIAPGWEQLLEKVLLHPQTIALGEIGLDKVCLTPFEKQLEVFHYQLSMANRLRMPVVLHVVRSMELVLPVRKQYPEIPGFLIHGFRGQALEAQQWLRNGFHLSFGPRFHPGAVQVAKTFGFFVETDDSGSDLRDVYCKVADAAEMSPAELEEDVEKRWADWLKKKKAVPRDSLPLNE